MQLIPGYQITERLYESRRSLIYRARREEDGRPVVMKVINAEYPSAEQIARLRREYRVTRGMRASGVIEVLALERYRNSFALIMEDIGGESLLRLERGRPMELGVLLGVAIRLAETIGEVHQRRVMHKDVTPGNIVWNPTTDVVRLIDFGIATELPLETSAILSPEVLEGTLAYMSPEQTGRMNRSVDYRTDLYSLGVTFYELLTGELPFTAEDPLELVHCHIAKVPRPPRELRPELPQVLSDIVLRLMAKHAEDRYQSGFALRADLLRCRELLDATGAVPLFPLAAGGASERFQLPKKLYGREEESRALLSAFERVSEGGAETMFVAGYSGIGKSSLVHEVHRPIVKRRGYFVSGKFDQFQRNIPYASLIQAFRELVRQLLTEPPAELARWRERIVAALRPNARVIIDVIRELELITGAQPPVPELGPREAENRLNFVFERFFRVFGEAGRPLVMFLDDLQWADLPSLKLLERLMADPETRHVFLIGAYRDNEVEGQHPLLLAQAALRKAGARVSTITLGPLSQEHCVELLSDTLRSPPDEVRPVAELCAGRTGGNPFFLSQYLLSLHHEGLFTFDGRGGRWHWDLDRLQRAPMADNVVDLMAGKIKLLEEDAQLALKLAACIGATFDLGTLSVVLRRPPDASAAALWPALREGLAVPVGESYKFAEDRVAAEAMLGRVAVPVPRSERSASKVVYRFLHDRVQQAAYSLVPEADRAALHLTVGRTLRDATPAEELHERIFQIVNQLDAGAPLITSDVERTDLAALNFAAGRKAKDSAAYGAALAYFRTGIRLLGEGGWEARRELTLELHLAAAETSYLNAEPGETDRFVDAALAHAPALLERVRAYEIRIQALMSQSRLLDAIAVGIEALRQLGVTFPDERRPEDAMAALLGVHAELGDRSIASLIDLPEITDPRVLAEVRIMNKMASSSYLADQRLFPFVVVRYMQTALRHGNTGGTAFGYVTYGTLRTALFGDIEGGYAFGQLASRVIERFNAREYETRTNTIRIAFLDHWREPLRAAGEAFMENYRSGFETGDLEYTAWSGKQAAAIFYWLGDDLAEIRLMARRLTETLRRINQEVLVQYVSTLVQVTESLTGDDPEPWRLTGRGHDFDALMASYRATGNSAGLCWAHLHRLVLCVLFGRTEEALAALAVCEETAGSTMAMPYVPIMSFYFSLAWIAACAGAPPGARRELLAKVEANQRDLKIWAENAPWDRAQHWALVEAELARERGDREAARDLYYRAMGLARERGNRRDEALATELFARFLLDRGEQEAGQLFMAKASHLYDLWGAKAKVRDLERRYPSMLSRSAPRPEVAEDAPASVISTTQGRSEALDFSSVVQASQAISGEVVLPELLRRIMLIVIQNAGARRGLLVVPGPRALVVDVDTAVQGEPRVEIHEGTIDGREDVPQAIVRYVERTREQVVLRDAAAEGAFQSDPDVARRRSRSILCLPVLHHKELAGVLYLENELVAGAFTPARCRVLELLAAQAAISLENARLYETLENRVRERTRELSEALENLRQTQRQLVAQEKLASLGLLTSGIAHELKNPLNFVINFAGLSVQLVEELRDELARAVSRLGPDGEAIEELVADLLQNARKIDQHGRRADEIVRSMLQHAGSVTGRRELVDLNQIVRDSARIAGEAFKLQRPEFESHLEAVLSPNLAPVLAAPQEIGQVVLNLVSNACYAVWDRARRAGAGYRPQVVVETRDAGEHVEIRVRDNGTGVPAAVQDKIFLPFFTTKPTGEGTGLGLSLSHDIVTGHNGTLELTSREGEGAEFVVRLPRGR